MEDATVGNGHDTRFLAECVLPGGRIYGFDVQEAALESTRSRLREAGVADDLVDLLHAGHEEMETRVMGPVAAVMFNLGYLPGGDHALTTSPGPTIAALRAAIGLLKPGGLVSVVCYQGHDGGREEADAVRAWAAALPESGFRNEVIGRESPGSGPFLVLVWRMPG